MASIQETGHTLPGLQGGNRSLQPAPTSSCSMNAEQQALVEKLRIERGSTVDIVSFMPLARMPVKVLLPNATAYTLRQEPSKLRMLFDGQAREEALAPIIRQGLFTFLSLKDAGGPITKTVVRDGIRIAHHGLADACSTPNILDLPPVRQELTEANWEHTTATALAKAGSALLGQYFDKIGVADLAWDWYNRAEGIESYLHWLPYSVQSHSPFASPEDAQKIPTIDISGLQNKH